MMMIFTPYACTRGKIISSASLSLSLSLIVDIKITKSRDLDTQVSCKRNKSVEFGKKMATVCLELRID